MLEKSHIPAFGDFVVFDKHTDFIEVVNKLNEMAEKIKKININDYECEIVIHEVENKFSLGFKYTMINSHIKNVKFNIVSMGNDDN